MEPLTGRTVFQGERRGQAHFSDMSLGQLRASFGRKMSQTPTRERLPRSLPRCPFFTNLLHSFYMAQTRTATISHTMRA